MNYRNKAIGGTSSAAFISSGGALISSVGDTSDSSIKNRPAIDVGNNNTDDNEIVTPTTSHFLPDSKSPTFSADPGKWDLRSHELINYWVSIDPPEKNSDGDCGETLRDFGLWQRSCSKSSFFTPKAQLDCQWPVGNCDWLIYSPKTRKIYCFTADCWKIQISDLH